MNAVFGRDGSDFPIFELAPDITERAERELCAEAALKLIVFCGVRPFFVVKSLDISSVRSR